MNQDDRKALVEIGRQYAEHLYQHVEDAGSLADESVIALVADTMAFLVAEKQPDPALPLPQDGVDPATLERVLRRHDVQYHDHEVVELPPAEAGGRRRRTYRAVVRAAEVDDVMAMKVTPSGKLSLVVKDGKAYTFEI